MCVVQAQTHTDRNKQAHAHSLGDTYTHTRFPSFVKCKKYVKSHYFFPVFCPRFIYALSLIISVFIMNLFENFMIRCEFEPCSNNETPLHLTYNYLAAKTKFFTVTVNYKQQQKKEKARMRQSPRRESQG